MICVSLAEESLPACLEALEKLDFAEIRVDAMPFLTHADLRNIFSRPSRLIATCRPEGLLASEDRKAMLITAIESGAAYVDVEAESEPGYREEIVTRARSCGCGVIISFHDHDKTPERQELEAIVGSCFEAGADVVKVACMVHSGRDCARLLGLLDFRGSRRPPPASWVPGQQSSASLPLKCSLHLPCDSRRIVVIGMGEKGRITRIVAPLLGSPFTFASLSKGKETAEGQIDKDTLERMLEGLTQK